jgi:hypothetical protein
LEIVGPFEPDADGDDLEWWPVREPETQQSGYMREDFLEEAA